MNKASNNCILSAEITERKLKRMAFEIAENNFDATSIIIAGVKGNGAVVAQNLQKELGQILQVDIELRTISLDKRNPVDVTIDGAGDLNGKVIIVVDDVADSGRTLFYALKPFLNAAPKKIQTLVLVERSHKLFPIQADYVGLSVATTLQEHISVEVEGEKITGAFLN